MTPDQLALDHLAKGDVEGAVNVISRQESSPWVNGCVKLARHKFVEAASQFFSAKRPTEGVAVALLEPWEQFHRLTSCSDIPSELAQVVGCITSEKLLDRSAVTAVAKYIPSEAAGFVDVASKLAELNVFFVARVSENVRISTLEQVVTAVGDFSAEELVASLVESGRIKAKIDQVAQIVEFHKSDQSSRQTAHLQALFDRVEQLSSGLAH